MILRVDEEAELYDATHIYLDGSSDLFIQKQQLVIKDIYNRPDLVIYD